MGGLYGQACGFLPVLPTPHWPEASPLATSNYREGEKGNVVVCLGNRFGDFYQYAVERSLHPLFFFHKLNEKNKQKRQEEPMDFKT